MKLADLVMVKIARRRPPPTCGATDGLGVFPDEPEDTAYGRCNLPPGHQTLGWHQEWRDGRLWAEWRGPAPGEKCGICGKDGGEH